MYKLTSVMLIFLGLPGCISQPSLFSSVGPLQESTVSGEGEQKILMIDIAGMLTSSKPSGFIDQIVDRPSLPARLKEELLQASEDQHIKAVILRINSPGGTVTASDILHHEIQEFKEKYNIPVIASILDLGTSGGYYLATAADRIIAHPSTITGSIGVIMVSINAEGLLQKIGVTPRTITSGPNKAMGSPFHTMTDEERAIFQGVIDSMYEQFVAVVKAGRPNLNEQEIRRLADGRIYTASQALDAGLIDTIGYMEDAVALAKKQANLDEATVITYHRAGGYKHNIYSSTLTENIESRKYPSLDASSLLTLLSGGAPQFLYMWMT